MPTNHDETLLERYAREHEAEMAMLAKMTPDEIHGLCLQLHNALAERDALRAELAEVKGREAVPVAIANKGDRAFWVSWTDAGKPLRGPGIKLYASPPASPDVEGLVKALEDVRNYIGSQPVKTIPWSDGIRSGYRLEDGAMGTLRILGKIDTALSTWRQAHTPSTLPASSAEE